MKKQGQIAIIALFALSIFAVVGGSVITQIIFEQRKAVVEQKSKEAYYAAESGIEKALLEIINNNDPNYSGTNLPVGNAVVNVSTAASAGGTNYVVPTELFPGQSYYLNLKTYSSSTNKIRLCWNKASSSLVTMYFYTFGGNRRVRTDALNATGTTNISGTGPKTALVDAGGGCGLSGTVYYWDLELVASAVPDYLVVWAAYQDGIQLAFAGLNGGIIPSQGTVISSSAEVEEGTSNVTRQVKYFVSQVGNTNLNYPPNYLLVPVYAVGGVSY